MTPDPIFESEPSFKADRDAVHAFMKFVDAIAEPSDRSSFIAGRGGQRLAGRHPRGARPGIEDHVRGGARLPRASPGPLRQGEAVRRVQPGAVRTCRTGRGHERRGRDTGEPTSPDEDRPVASGAVGGKPQVRRPSTGPRPLPRVPRDDARDRAGERAADGDRTDTRLRDLGRDPVAAAVAEYFEKHIDEEIGPRRVAPRGSRGARSRSSSRPRPAAVTHRRRRHRRAVLLDPPLPPRCAARLHDAARGIRARPRRTSRT